MYTIAMFRFKEYFLLFKSDKITIRQFLKVLGHGNTDHETEFIKPFQLCLKLLKKKL